MVKTTATKKYICWWTNIRKNTKIWTVVAFRSVDKSDFISVKVSKHGFAIAVRYTHTQGGEVGVDLKVAGCSLCSAEVGPKTGTQSRPWKSWTVNAQEGKIKQLFLQDWMKVGPGNWELHFWPLLQTLKHRPFDYMNLLLHWQDPQEVKSTHINTFLCISTCVLRYQGQMGLATARTRPSYKVLAFYPWTQLNSSSYFHFTHNEGDQRFAKLTLSLIFSWLLRNKRFGKSLWLFLLSSLRDSDGKNLLQ